MPDPPACPWEPLSRWLALRGKAMKFHAVEPVTVPGEAVKNHGALVVGITDNGKGGTHAVVLDHVSRVVHDPAGQVEPSYRVTGVVSIETTSSRARELCPWCQSG